MSGNARPGAAAGEDSGDVPERLRENARTLRRAQRILRTRERDELADSYGAEWFLDNYYLIRSAIRQALQDLPRSFYDELPRLTPGVAGTAIPRAHALALSLVDDSEARLDLPAVEVLVAAYQESAPLSMGELWALPALLRAVVIDRLTRSISRLSPDLAAGAVPPGHPGSATDDEQVASCIRSLHALRNHDWRAFFERLSFVERILRGEPAGVYARMDFATRDRYRKVIESLAAGAGRDETEVARAAVDLASEATAAMRQDQDDGHAAERRAHVGYYLIAGGVPSLRQRVGYSPSLRERLRDLVFLHPAAVYLGAVGLATLIVLGLAFRHASAGGVAQQLAVLLVLLVPALSLGVGVVNLLLGHVLKPRLLPKLDFSRGIPAEYRTMVVVPAIIPSAEGVDELVRELERHYLGNQETELLFALLTDLADADEAEKPDDAGLIARAVEGIGELNRRHGGSGRQPFYLFHRKRILNESEGAWMGWERKRGKLLELNRLLRGAGDTSHSVKVGDMSRLPGVRYVLTLDADTRLPPNAARRLAGTLAHPLNRAEFDARDRVTAGYSLLQPRTEILPESANATYFSRLFAGGSGLDLYSLAVSNIYQDLFGNGIYMGKGIYSVDDFTRALRGKVPENTILSHDLLEGIYGGAGLVSDVVLYENHPANYLAEALRMQRWVRGDWQLLPWLTGSIWKRGSDPGGLGVVGSWKILDNLRRSLLMPSIVLALVLGWTVLVGSPAVWTLVALGALLVPLVGSMAEALATVAQRRGETDGARRSAIPWPSLGAALQRFVITVAFMAYEALMILVSVGTALSRLFITRRKLLEWRTAAQAERSVANLSLAGTVAGMGPGLLLALLLLALVILLRPEALWVAAPVILLWLAAPFVAYRSARPLELAPERLDEAQWRRVHKLARRTWLYFEQFVGPEDNWLPPDNVQVGAVPVTAHRTSPTNIGLLLLSTMSAHDLGYLGLVDLSLRLRQTLQVIGRMEHYRGHLLNWFDTRSLQPLAPRYVSSVDSGNLLGSLIAVREGCFELLTRPVEPRRRWGGLIDTIDVLEEILAQALGSDSAPVAHLGAVRARIGAAAERPGEWSALIDHLERESVVELRRLLVEAIDDGTLPPEQHHAVRAWTERVAFNIRVTQREFSFLLPWIRALADARAWEDELPPAAAAILAGLRELWDEPPALRHLEEQCHRALELVEQFRHAAGDTAAPVAREWAGELARHLVSSASAARGLVDSFEEIARLADEEVRGADFAFLYDHDRDLLRIGYNVDTERLDDNYYDLLASESRLGSLVAIAKGDLPVRHWLHLGRPLADAGGRATLLSWSGTMFEYLMPNLLTRRFGGTLLEQSCAAAIDEQMAYARSSGVPWGISESGYGRVDATGTFQYRAFGVPGLALDRGQESDLVVAPYASMLALGFRPGAVIDNLRHFEEQGALGPYGLYEALDYTPARKPLGRNYRLVSSYMAHHQGMILVSLANALTHDAMVRRFHADPRIATVELLLQERVPTHAPFARQEERERPRPAPEDSATLDRPWQAPPDGAFPQAHLLSNGHYSILITAAGGGYSACDDTTITRWNDDPVVEEQGTFIYVHDPDSGALWSLTRQPLGMAAEEERVEFHPHMAVFTRLVDGVSSRLDVAVADENAELRCVTLINQSDRPRRLRLTSYAEVVLGDAAGDRRHPAFSKLFVESSYLPDQDVLLFRRRPRSSEEPPLYAAHALVNHDGRREPDGSREYESDRLRFLGRGRDARNPAGPRTGLGNTSGATLDPVMALAETVELAAHSRTTLTFVTAYGTTRQQLLDTVARLRRPGAVRRSLELARNRSRTELRRNRLEAGELRQFQLLLSALLFPTSAMRADPAVLAANTAGQPGLWGHGISGDHPILLLRVGRVEELPLAADLVRAHGYWRRRGVKVDMVILNSRESGYSQELQGRLRRLLSRAGGDDWLHARGGIHLLLEDQLAPVDATLLASVARVIMDAADGPLEQQLARLARQPEELPVHQPIPPEAGVAAMAPAPPERDELLFANGWGGFTEDGREYRIHLPGGELPPAPWSNVIANEAVGFLTTEAGLGSTWAANSGENRLTPWHNDPVSDRPSEVVYLRDEESAEVWSATPLPGSLENPFQVRHGAGYTVWQHSSRGLEQELEAFVAAEDPVKLVRLRLVNHSGRVRRVTATYFAPWVLGVDSSATRLHVVPAFDAGHCALLARNRYSTEFGHAEAFLASNKAPHGVTTDRREFIGRLGSLRRPAALARIGLSGTVEAGTDPCAALQLHLDLRPGESEEVLFVLGQAEDRVRALELIDRYRDLGRLQEHRQAVEDRWEELLGKVQVETPDPAMNLLTNRWLAYQTVSARLWGRSAFYQSSGAFGFRDQLQDVLALLYAAPELAREQILRAAAHQFEEGDVLHWWHPPSGRGVRTRISDDLLWLPFVTARYVAVTNDLTVLDEEVPFLTGSALRPDEHERYDHYPQGGSGTVLEHCRRALLRGATVGRNGLPLMGGGDWNDGMNRVGVEGKGESVWLTWFLMVTLRDFAALLRRTERDAEADRFEDMADRYGHAAREHAWDGDWYLRAFYDDGGTLGSQQDSECRIDSIAQSWSVFALGDHERGRRAMANVDQLLVREGDGLIRLFTPAFDRTTRDPGYIKGYLPGVRENGGQYTHAAIWAAWAFTQLRDGDRAFELYRLLAPLNHAATPEGAERYKVEPYVVAADVYSLEPHVGRGGWTWYTGSASWLQRLALEAILGLQKRGQDLHFDPCLPRHWNGFRATWREGASTYRIRVVTADFDAATTLRNRTDSVRAPAGARTVSEASRETASARVRQVTLDGRPRPDPSIPLIDDGADHDVLVELG